MNKLIVIGHDTRCDGTGELNGEIFQTLEAARQYVKDQGYESEEFGWNKNETEYSDEENHIYFMKKEIL